MQKISLLKQSEPGFSDNVKNVGINGSFSGESREIKASFKEILSSDVSKTRSIAASDEVAGVIVNSRNVDPGGLQKQQTRLVKGGDSIAKHLLSKGDLEQVEGLVDSESQIHDGKMQSETRVEDGSNGSVVGLLRSMVVQDEKKILVDDMGMIVNGGKTGVMQKDQVGSPYDNKRTKTDHKAAVKGSSRLRDSVITNTTIAVNSSANIKSSENQGPVVLDVVAKAKEAERSIVSEIVRQHVNVGYDKAEDQKPLVVTEKMLTKIKDSAINVTEFAGKEGNETVTQGKANPDTISAKIAGRFFGELNNLGEGAKINKVKTENVDSDSKVIDDVVFRKDVQFDRAKVSVDRHRLDQSFTVTDKLNVNGELRNSARDAGLDRHNSMNYKEDSLSEPDLSLNKLVSSDESKNEGNNVDRNIKVEQKIVHVQNGKNELFGQNQKKNEFVLQSNSQKNKEGKSELVDVGSISANEKKFMSGKAQTIKMPVNIQNNANHDLKSQFGDMVVSGAKQFIKGGNQEIHLTIRKPNLGNLKISFVERGKGGLDISIVAERADAVDVIKQNSGELKLLLSQDGIDLSKFDVYSDNSRDRGRLAHNDGYQRKHQKREDVEDEGLSHINDKDVERYTQEVQSNGLVTGNSQINVFV